MKPRVLILDSSRAVTGGLRGAQRMARLLKPHADFTLVLPTDAEMPAGELSHFDEVVRLPLAPLRRSLGAALRYGPALLRSGMLLRRLLRSRNAHALIVNDFVLPHGWIARRLGFDGRILTWVRFDPKRFPAAVSGAWLRAAAASADAIVAVSDFVGRRLPESMRAIRIYDPVDLDLPVGRATGGHRHVVCVGNIIRGKGQEHAIEAFRRVCGSFPEARLIFHGGDMGLAKNRAFRAELEARARQCGLAERVLFRGYAPDLAPVFADAAVALNLSESETFSLTCLEAGQCGVPVIAFRSGGPSEIIEDGVTGYLCEVGDVADVAERLACLLADPAAAGAMGKSAARHVANKFGTDRYVRELRSLLVI